MLRFEGKNPPRRKHPGWLFASGRLEPPKAAIWGRSADYRPCFSGGRSSPCLPVSAATGGGFVRDGRISFKNVFSLILWRRFCRHTENAEFRAQLDFLFSVSAICKRDFYCVRRKIGETDAPLQFKHRDLACQAARQPSQGTFKELGR